MSVEQNESQRITVNSLISICRDGTLLHPKATNECTKSVMKAFFDIVAKYHGIQEDGVTSNNVYKGVYNNLISVDGSIANVADCFVAFIIMFNNSQSFRQKFYVNFQGNNQPEIALQMSLAKKTLTIENKIGIGGLYHALPVAVDNVYKDGFGKVSYYELKQRLPKFCAEHKIYFDYGDVVYRTKLCKVVELDNTIGLIQALYSLYILSLCDKDSCDRVFKMIDDSYMDYVKDSKAADTVKFITFITKSMSIVGYTC